MAEAKEVTALVASIDGGAELQITLAVVLQLLSSLPQETALECHFGVERTFEARWVNSSAVECVHVLVSQGMAVSLWCCRAGPVLANHPLAPQRGIETLSPPPALPALPAEEARSRLVPQAGACCVLLAQPCSAGTLERSCLVHLVKWKSSVTQTKFWPPSSAANSGSLLLK